MGRDQEHKAARSVHDDARSQELERVRNLSRRVEGKFADLSDSELIGLAHSTSELVQAPMEMARRLIVSNRDLKEEIVIFRKSSDRASDALARLTRWLILLTILLVIMTGVLIYLAFAGS